METLIVYDGVGKILYQGQGDMYVPVGVPSMWVEVPTNKIAVSVDVSDAENPVPVYETLPEQPLPLQDKIAELDNTITELLEVTLPTMLAMLNA